MDNTNNPNGPRPGKAKQEKIQHSAQNSQGPNPMRGKSKYRPSATFSASGIHNDDIGIFVTSDKGQEKRCLQELSDLLGEFFDEDVDGRRSKEAEDTGSTESMKGKEEVNKAEHDIEAEVFAELDSLRPHAQNGGDVSVAKLSLVTLDIPCVSFVRFPTGTSVDPVQVVRKLCLNAADKDYAGPRSRYIKRLTPVSLVRKTLNDGLTTLCDQVLPKRFQIDPEATDSEPTTTTEKRPSVGPCKFAIRPTIRNNNKVNRDIVIRTVADKVTAFGQDKHKVDLKGYDKLILVDVYRNVVGMSVVGSEFETLKRFNLAELHAEHLGHDDIGDDGGGE